MTHRRTARSHRGTALILVLWLVAALSLVVLAGARSVRQQTQGAAIDLERLRTGQVLDTALQLVIQRLAADSANAGRYRQQTLQIGSQSVQVEVIPASGLVDFTVASEALQLALLQRVGGLTPGEAAIMASRIKDYIDPDDEPSGVGGAEAPQYRAAGRTAMPRNAGLDDPVELRMVLGMTPELYEIIAPYLSINGQQRLSIDAAPPALIDALMGQPGLGVQVQSSPPETRAAAFLSGAAADLFASGSAGGGAVKLRAVLQTEAGRWWQREAWVDLNRPDVLTPWTTVSLEPTRRMNPPQQEIHP
ncbi:MAG: type II secretion system protein GspK [Acidovorax sp.]